MTHDPNNIHLPAMPLPPELPPDADFPCCAPTGFGISLYPTEPTYTASEVKLLTETATKLGRAIGRKEACDEAIDRLSELAQRIAPGNPHPVLGRDTVVRYLRDIASLPAGATSDATSGVPGHQEVSEAVRSPQEPCDDLECWWCRPARVDSP